MSQDLPLPSNIEIDVTLSQIFDTTTPTVDAATYGYLYKLASNNGLFWKTLTGGAIDLTAPAAMSSFGTATSLFGGTITVVAPSNTKAGSSALSAMGAGTLGGASTAFGSSALSLLTDVANQGIYSAFGYEAGKVVTTGVGSMFLGFRSGVAITTSSYDLALGYRALGQSTTTAGNNVSIGADSMYSATFSGSYNVGVGNNCLSALTTGTYNSALGHSAGNTLATGNYNTLLGEATACGAAHDYCVVIGSDAVSTATNQIRIGFDASGVTRQTTCFIDGVRGRTSGVADAVAVLVDSKGQMSTISSSIRYKENVLDVSDNVIDSLFKMEPKTFNYIGNPDSKTYGLIAEDIDKILPDIVVYKEINGEMVPETIQYHLLVPLLVGAVKRLNLRCDELQRQLNL